MNPKGRRSLFTPQVADGIVLAIRAGVPMGVAAESQGVSDKTMYDWLRAGRGEPSKIDPSPEMLEQLRDFSERVAVARAEAHVMAVGTIRQAIAKGNWQAALAWIKLRYPQHYAERMEVTGPGGGPIAMEIAQALEGLTEDELASIEAHLASSGDPEPTRPRRARTKGEGP